MLSHSNILARAYTAIRGIGTTGRVSIRVMIASRQFPGEYKGLAIGREDWAPSLFKIANAELAVTGREKVNFDTPHVYVMNHQSLMDIPAAFMAIPVNISFISKKELESVPLMGRAMRDVGMVFVDRTNPARAFASLKAAGELIRSGVNVFAFPEGTRSKDGRIQPFKKGPFFLAIEAGVPVVPMAVHGANEVLSPNGFVPTPGLIKVAIGDPISTKGYTPENTMEVIAKVRASVIALNKSMGGLGGDLD